jgi:hypothetical protein
VRRRSSADAIQETEIARVIRERDEALEQQAAISDILEVISNSPADVQPVLDSVAEHAARICEAHVVDIAIVADGAARHRGAVQHLLLSIASRVRRTTRPSGTPRYRELVAGVLHVGDMDRLQIQIARVEPSRRRGVPRIWLVAYERLQAHGFTGGLRPKAKSKKL